MIKLNQNAWLKSYIDMSIGLRNFYIFTEKLLAIEMKKSRNTLE